MPANHNICSHHLFRIRFPDWFVIHLQYMSSVVLIIVGHGLLTLKKNPPKQAPSGFYSTILKLNKTAYWVSAWSHLELKEEQLQRLDSNGLGVGRTIFPSIPVCLYRHCQIDVWQGLCVANLKAWQQITLWSEKKKVDCLDDSGCPSCVTLIKHLYFRRTKGGMSVRSGAVAHSCFLVHSNYNVCQNVMCIGLLMRQWVDEFITSQWCLRWITNIPGYVEMFFSRNSGRVYYIRSP